jgi:opacity protein-like surface antigen
MKKFIVAAALVAAAASVANARDDEPSRESVEEFAHQLAQDSKKQGMSLRETANHLVSSIWWSEKMQLFCSSYFYVNARKARYDYLLRIRTWNENFGVGKDRRINTE